MKPTTVYSTFCWNNAAPISFVFAASPWAHKPALAVSSPPTHVQREEDNICSLIEPINMETDNATIELRVTATKNKNLDEPAHTL